MSKINVKQVDLTHRYKDNDILVAPTTVLDQVKINDTELPDGTIVEGIEKTPAYIYNGKIPKNLNEALKNLAENVKGAVGGQVTALKVGPDGTPIDPDPSGIITFPLATDTANGAINKADIKTMIDDADNARDAKRPTVNNKVMTGVKADGTAEYYDIGAKLNAPGTGKAFAGFTGGDITQPEWADIKTAVAQKPFTGSVTIEGQTYSPDQIGLSTTYIDAVLSNVKIVESDTLTPRADNTYTGIKDDSAKTLTITIPKAEGKVKDVKIGTTSIVNADGNAIIPVKSTYSATDTDPINGVGVNEALKTLDVTDTAVTDQYVSQVSETDGKIAVTRVELPVKDVKVDGVSVVTNKIADIPLSSSTKYGVAKLDLDKIDSASTSKTNDPILMTGKAIEDSLAVKKVNGNASIYAHNASVPIVDNAIALGAGATVSAAGGVAVGAGATTASTNDVAIGFGASTASDGSIAIGKSAAARNTTSVALGNSSTAKGISSVAVGDTADAEAQNAIAIGKNAYVDKTTGIAIGSNTMSNNIGEIAIGRYNKSIADTDAQIGTAFTVGDGTNSEAHNLIEQKANADLYIPGIGGYDGKNSDPTDYELDEDGNPIIHKFDGYPIKNVKPLQEAIVEDIRIKTSDGGQGGTYSSVDTEIIPGENLGYPPGTWIYKYFFEIDKSITITEDIEASFSITGNVRPILDFGGALAGIISATNPEACLVSVGTSDFNTSLTPQPDAIGSTLPSQSVLILISDSDTYTIGEATFKIEGGEETWETIVDHHIAKLPVDNALDETSYNPVANKVVTKSFLWKKGDAENSLIAKNMGEVTCDGEYSIVAGNDLEVHSDHSFVMGENNQTSYGSSDTIMMGHDNESVAGGRSIVIGSDNRNGGSSVYINGSNNTIDNVSHTIVAGDYNTTNGGNALLICGNSNIFDLGTSSTIVAGEECRLHGNYGLVIGYNNHNENNAKYTSMIGDNLTVSHDHEYTKGKFNRTATVYTNNNHICDSVAYGVDEDHRRNLNETWWQGERYIIGIGDFDGYNSNPDIYKKNADGTDYVNPLTNKREHEVQSLQETIEIMNARIKYLEDIVEQLTQQRNPVEP